MIHIVTDTDANLPSDVLKKYGIPAACIQIIFGDEVLRGTHPPRRDRRDTAEQEHVSSLHLVDTG